MIKHRDSIELADALYANKPDAKGRTVMKPSTMRPFTPTIGTRTTAEMAGSYLEPPRPKPVVKYK